MTALVLIYILLLNLSFIFFLQAKAALINFKVLEICGGCGSITFPLFDFIKHLQSFRFFFFKLLSLKKIILLLMIILSPGGSVGCLCTAATKK